MKRHAVFFDRDGTLMEEVNYCADPAKVRLYQDVPEGLKKLKEAGFQNIIVTNQSGIGRGLFSEAQYRSVQAELLAQIGEGLIDASYFCPDVPDTPSTHRKPEPGMLFDAAADFDIALSDSYMIGDKAADIECGQRAGTKTILVRTGYGADQDCRPDFHARDVGEAIEIVLAENTGKSL